MKYVPKFTKQEDEYVDLEDLFSGVKWKRIRFEDIAPGDRVLVFRYVKGVRVTMEGTVLNYSHKNASWRGGNSTPLVSCLDTNIFRFEDDQ